MISTITKCYSDWGDGAAIALSLSPSLLRSRDRAVSDRIFFEIFRKSASYSARPSTRVTFVPPNPNELDSANFIGCSVGVVTGG